MHLQILVPLFDLFFTGNSSRFKINMKTSTSFVTYGFRLILFVWFAMGRCVPSTIEYFLNYSIF